MSQKAPEEKLLLKNSVDVIGLIPRKLLDSMTRLGYYHIEPYDAFPFKIRVKHKLGFECVIEAETETELLNEAMVLVEVMGPTLKEYNSKFTKE